MAQYLLHKGNAEDRQPFYGAIILNDNGGPIEVYGAYIPYYLEPEAPHDLIAGQEEFLRGEVQNQGDLLGVAHRGSYSTDEDDGLVWEPMASQGDLDMIRSYKYITSIAALLKERAAREAEDADGTAESS
jgi:hypothetical protein